jgi:hypothetical protein
MSKASSTGETGTNSLDRVMVDIETLCLIFGVGAAVNVALLAHIHVVEIGLFTQYELVDDNWVYYANTAVHTMMFGTFVWLISNDMPDTMEIHR